MVTYKRKNFSKEKLAGFAWPINPQPGDVFERCNFTQLTPTAIPAEYTGLTFIRCNMVNVIPPPDADLIECNNRMVSRCTHLHPQYIEQGLAECPENCSHVIDTEEIELDGETIYIYQYRDTIGS
jgi:hypothetical protein